MKTFLSVKFLGCLRSLNIYLTHNSWLFLLQLKAPAILTGNFCHWFVLVFHFKTLPILCPCRVSSLVCTPADWLTISNAGTPNQKRGVQPVVIFQEKSREAKGLNLPSILEKIHIHVFLIRESVQKIEFHAKKLFSYQTIVYWAFGSLLLPRICRLHGTWGHFVTLPPCYPLLSTVTLW